MKDTIKIKVEEYSWKEIINYEDSDQEETDETATKHGIECKVEINGKEIKHYTDLFAFLREFVNKSVVSNYQDWYGESYKDTGYAYIPITKSWHYGQSNFYPFTCSCGVAGCASIWNGIHVKWRKNSIEYRIKDKRDGYENILDKMFYLFDRKQYELEVLTSYQTLCKLVEKNPDNESAWIVEEFKGKIKDKQNV